MYAVVYAKQITNEEAQDEIVFQGTLDECIERLEEIDNEKQDAERYRLIKL